MANRDDSPRRRDVLKAGGVAGLFGLAGLATNGVSAQDGTTTAASGGTGVFSYSLQEGDLFRVRYRPRTPFGDPATESVPAACLGGDQPEEYQLFVVRAFRSDTDIGFRGLLAPQMALAEDLLETTTAADGGPTETADGTTTGAAMQDETTAADGQETTPAGDELPVIGLGEWYTVTAVETCDGMNRLTIESADAPETTPTPSGGVEGAGADGTTADEDGAGTTTQ